MVEQRWVRRVVGGGALVAVAALTGAEARADGPKRKNACAAVYSGAMDKEQAGHLRDAREAYASCARPACGAAMLKDCAARVADLDASIARVAPVVTADSGEPIVDVMVKVDGDPWTSRLDGRALPLDPGVHEFWWAAERGTPNMQKMMIVQGQRGPLVLPFRLAARPVAKPAPSAAERPPTRPSAAERPPTRPSAAAVDTAPDPGTTSSDDARAPAPEGANSETVSETPPAPLHGGTSAWPFVVVGVGVLAVGAGALLTYWGRKDNDALARCSPHCVQSNVDHVQTMYVAADVSFGVGIAALATAAVALVVQRPSRESARPPRGAITLDVAPIRSGAAVGITGTF